MTEVGHSLCSCTCLLRRVGVACNKQGSLAPLLLRQIRLVSAIRGQAKTTRHYLQGVGLEEKADQKGVS